LLELLTCVAATQIVDVLASNLPAFIDVMMVEELQIMPSQSMRSIIVHSALTCVSTLIGNFPF
jgi:hypothetical protein